MAALCSLLVVGVLESPLHASPRGQGNKKLADKTVNELLSASADDLQQDLAELESLSPEEKLALAPMVPPIAKVVEKGPEAGQSGDNAIKLLVALGPVAEKEGYPALVKNVAYDNMRGYRYAAGQALKKIGAPAVPYLAAALQERGADDRALKAILVGIGTPEAIRAAQGLYAAPRPQKKMDEEEEAARRELVVDLKAWEKQQQDTWERFGVLLNAARVSGGMWALDTAPSKKYPYYQAVVSAESWRGAGTRSTLAWNEERRRYEGRLVVRLPEGSTLTVWVFSRVPVPLRRHEVLLVRDAGDRAFENQYGEQVEMSVTQIIGVGGWNGDYESRKTAKVLFTYDAVEVRRLIKTALGRIGNKK